MNEVELQAVADRLVGLVRTPEDWAADKRTEVWRAVAERTIRKPAREPRGRWMLVVAPVAAALALGIWGAYQLVPGSSTHKRLTEVATSEAGVESKTTPAALENQPASPVASYQKTTAHRIDLGDIGTIELSEGAAEHAYQVRDLAEERQIYFAAGRLRAHIAHQEPSRPVVVVTPHVRVVVVGTRFDVVVDQALSSVEVQEGRVRVEANGQTVMLGAGDRILSDDRRLQAPGGTGPAVMPANPAIPPAPSQVPASASPSFGASGSPLSSSSALGAEAATVAACEAESDLARRRACFERLAKGSGLSAENALYALGQLARDGQRESALALEYWRSYQKRFPDGALAPEVSLNVLRGLLALNRSDEALAEASAFQQRFGNDPRAPEVALVRADLLCAQRERAEAALSIYRGLAEHSRAELRERAIERGSACARRYGLAPLRRPGAPEPSDEPAPGGGPFGD